MPCPRHRRARGDGAPPDPMRDVFVKNRPFGARPLCAVLAATLFLVLTPPSWSADKQNPAKIVEDLDRRIERVVNGLLPPVVLEGAELRKMKLADRMAALRIPGVSIAMIHDGAIQWARGFGVRSLGGPPVTPDDLFQAGSISKPVTAVAALSFVEDSKLHLDSDVDLALTSWKIPATPLTREAKATLRELLAHRAGVNVPGFYGYASNALLPSLIATLNGTAPANNPPIIVEVEPGTQYHYSGGGYTIVQQLLIDVSGQPFPRLLQDCVLRPFGMTRSGDALSGEWRTGRGRRAYLSRTRRRGALDHAVRPRALCHRRPERGGGAGIPGPVPSHGEGDAHARSWPLRPRADDRRKPRSSLFLASRREHRICEPDGRLRIRRWRRDHDQWRARSGACRRIDARDRA
ncbi:hypothetical protein CU048_08665 [Beijerinckiaceae bacterium]|nr:hypothetical protein CU048_08665 [Beijerinckiaceae bacterium]